MTKPAHTYGYGIIDRHGKPWWDESCVCQDRGPMQEQVAHLNDRLDTEWDEVRAPFRVVRLIWVGKGRGK